jgi:hypothetical protein
MRSVIKVGFLTFPLVVGAAAQAADNDFPIAGTYLQNRPCQGDGTDPKPLLVTITPEEITYTGGVCTLSDTRQDGNKVNIRATCRGKSGKILVGNVTFTIRDDKNLDMVDQDHNYTAVLNKCPG